MLWAVLVPAPAFGVAKTMVVEPPLKAGSLLVSTAAAFCDSVPGMLKVSFVFPPLAWPVADRLSGGAG